MDSYITLSTFHLFTVSFCFCGEETSFQNDESYVLKDPLKKHILKDPLRNNVLAVLFFIELHIPKTWTGLVNLIAINQF